MIPAVVAPPPVVALPSAIEVAGNGKEGTYQVPKTSQADALYFEAKGNKPITLVIQVVSLAEGTPVELTAPKSGYADPKSPGSFAILATTTVRNGQFTVTVNPSQTRGYGFAVLVQAPTTVGATFQLTVASATANGHQVAITGGPTLVWQTV